MVDKKHRNKWAILILFALACFGVEILGSLFTQSSVESWYPTLNKPSWTPPPWIFGPVWTVLYLTIAISGWILYLQPKSPAKLGAIYFYWVQLGLNLLWSFLFFYLRSILLGLINISFLVLAISGCLYYFAKIAPRASCLMIPYLAWTLYALSLNIGLFALNE